MAIHLDWAAIRPLEGSRAKGFEELCAQIARFECPQGARFERKGTPDAGVECYASLDGGNEWGWQAKYIDGLGDAQWSQLDDSVRTALEKHPQLVRYIICAPLDRADARVDGRRSAKQRWDEHVDKWKGWASARGMMVAFDWWGNYELLDRLAHPQHVGRVHFWFDVRGFDNDWFQARLTEALKTAGPRYTPEIHIDLPLAADLEILGRTSHSFDQIKTYARAVRRKLQDFSYSMSKVAQPSLDEPGATVSKQVQAVLVALGELAPEPVGNLPFQNIANLVADTEVAIAAWGDSLLNFERELEAKHDSAVGKSEHPLQKDNCFRDCRYHLRSLEYELQNTRAALEHAAAVTNSALMLINGAAGTGKTHLLCDVAKQRLAAGKPTILLMGQQFISTEPPWSQAAQQLDLPGISAEEFVGALESAAQATGCRALILVDGINEGAGRTIWPPHLPAFLAHIERSPWISIALSVRTSYEEAVLPEEVRSRAFTLTHRGFSGNEYDATRTFFVFYGLELPSTPLLAPEFRNPLFLKTLCRGLKATGKRRLERGFHGITVTFDLYLSAINRELAQASKLNFNYKQPLVRQALEELAKGFVNAGERWLPLEAAQQVISELLPGREFDRSLYRGLVAEGVLVEEWVWQSDSVRTEVVFIGYERFADHLVARILLDRHLDEKAPSVCFMAGNPLAFLWDKRQYVPAGLLEAFCIQIPERTGRELVSLAPDLKRTYGIGNAFRQSLVWRDLKAFFEESREMLNALIRNEYDVDETHDAILTVATLPEHPLNARFLHQRLLRDNMPDRDAWWSTYLHSAYGTHGAVDRLLDWASLVTPDVEIDGESVDLAAITLSWMLTTANRFVRDRATKALVSLLSNRLDAVVRLLQQFAAVDDPYIAERIYAVAYAVVTKTCDTERVGVIAQFVYDIVFAAGTPPTQILLRDYARGVVERALFLGAAINVDAGRIRPPYQSSWPHIPTMEEIKPLQPDWSRGSHESREIEWAQNRIGSSVMNDDFARYVIGTNSSSASNCWLARKLEDPLWQSAEERLQELVSTFSVEQHLAWQAFEQADQELRRASFHLKLPDWLLEKLASAIDESNNDSELNEAEIKQVEETSAAVICPPTVQREQTLSVLKELLSGDDAKQLDALLLAKDNEPRNPPGIELSLIQQYILWRVFDLGWTKERFGQFDGISMGSSGRDAAKAERIGKKYQWIAYHEILALIADHYQYREPYGDGGDRSYEGPWQDNLRDIDPTCTLQSTCGGTSFDGHKPTWWGSASYNDWGEPDDPTGWITHQDALPKLEELLRCTHPDDKSTWLNLHGHFQWRQQPPADKESMEVERRDIWYSFTGYLIRDTDKAVFMDWAKGVSSWGRSMPEPSEVSQMFLGEHHWAPASQYFQQPYFGDDGWKQPGKDCPVEVRTIALKYSSGVSEFDCSVKESFTLRLPASYLIDGMRLQWGGNNADYLTREGTLAAFDPTADSDGPSALLIREDILKDFLSREGLAVVWMVLGEKRVLGPGFSSNRHESIELSGSYLLTDNGVAGFVAHHLAS